MRCPVFLMKPPPVSRRSCGMMRNINSGQRRPEGPGPITNTNLDSNPDHMKTPCSPTPTDAGLIPRHAYLWLPWFMPSEDLLRYFSLYMMPESEQSLNTTHWLQNLKPDTSHAFQCKFHFWASETTLQNNSWTLRFCASLKVLEE